jgi:hypothetical protein
MENKNTLPYLVELTDEMRTKVCIVEDLVKLAILDGYEPPTWEEFVDMYDKSIFDLEIKQSNILVLRSLIKDYDIKNH